MQQQQPVHHRPGAHQIAHSPAGHGIGLGKALAQQQLILQVAVQTQIGARTVAQLIIHIIANHKDIPLHQCRLHHPQGLLRQHRAGGIVGGIEDDGTGFLRQRRSKGFSGDLEIILGDVQRHSLGTCHGDDGFIQGKGRGGDNHLVPLIQNAQQRSEQRFRSAHRHQHLIGGASHATGGFVLSDGLPQRGSTLIGGIVGLILSQSLHRRGLDCLGSVEIRLTNG